MKGRLALPAWLILLWMLQACLSYWTVPGVTKEEAMLVAMEKWRTKVTELDDGTISGSSNQISSTRWAMASCFCEKSEWDLGLAVTKSAVTLHRL